MGAMTAVQIASVVGATAAVGGLAYTIANQPKRPPPQPKPPSKNDENVRRARMRTAAELEARGGRESTILTDSDKLGGG